MALTNCPECNKQVSTHANSCPSCGFPLYGTQVIGPMAECEYCKKMISSELTTCPFCNVQVFKSHRGNQPYQTPPSNKPPKKSQAKLWIILFGLLVAGGLISRVTSPNRSQASTTTTQKSIKAVDYETDLTERCKDWIYYRNKAYKLAKEGDLKGAEKARIAMLTFDRDLHKNFTEQQISDEIARLEAGGK